ncbi:uncharacterized protein BJX67DRAFT_346553 [Aspergillus lucknowensis]|uniref:Uncharacterized protein n=1 Tax=Aspergillus lucknowensis TaxID=176173 RepID=A0ABR4M033_9EURO
MFIALLKKLICCVLQAQVAISQHPILNNFSYCLLMFVACFIYLESRYNHPMAPTRSHFSFQHIQHFLDESLTSPRGYLGSPSDGFSTSQTSQRGIEISNTPVESWFILGMGYSGGREMFLVNFLVNLHLMTVYSSEGRPLPIPRVLRVWSQSRPVSVVPARPHGD